MPAAQLLQIAGYEFRFIARAPMRMPGYSGAAASAVPCAAPSASPASRPVPAARSRRAASIPMCSKRRPEPRGGREAEPDPSNKLRAPIVSL
jgi:hypothetical protein